MTTNNSQDELIQRRQAARLLREHFPALAGADRPRLLASVSRRKGRVLPHRASRGFEVLPATASPRLSAKEMNSTLLSRSTRARHSRSSPSPNRNATA